MVDDIMVIAKTIERIEKLKLTVERKVVTVTRVYGRVHRCES